MNEKINNSHYSVEAILWRGNLPGPGVQALILDGSSPEGWGDLPTEPSPLLMVPALQELLVQIGVLPSDG